MSWNKLGLFDKLTVATVVGAAIIEALQQALKDADRVKAIAPVLNLDGGWNYAPLILLTVGAASWVAKQLLARTKWVQEKPVLPTAEEKTPPITKREFLPDDVTLTRIRELTAGLTGAQTRGVIEPYAGKWMRVSGKVHDVKFIGDNQAMLMLVGHNDKSFLYTTVPPIVFNAPQWKDSLHELKVGTEVSAQGCVAISGSETIMLIDGELI